MSKRLNDKYEIVKSADNKIDYKFYLNYVLESSSPLEIEKMFKYRQELTDSKKFTEDQIDQYFLRTLATPENIPPEVWMSLDEGNTNENKGEDEEDFNFQSSSSSESLKSYDIGDNDDISAIKFKENEGNFAQSSKIEKIGGAFELWPQKRIKSMIRDLPDEIPFTDMVNTIDITTADELQQRMNQTKYILYDRIGPEEIKESIPIETEAVVMDPPLEDGGLKIEELYEIFVFFKKHLNPPTKKVIAKKKKSKKANENENDTDNNNDNENTNTSSKKFNEEEEEEEEEEEAEENNFGGNKSKMSSNISDSFNGAKNKSKSQKKSFKNNYDDDDDDYFNYEGKENENKNKKKEKKLNPCVFIFIWSKPEHLALISSAASRAGLLFCDTVVVEMLDGNVEYYSIVGKSGFINKSKMIMIFRTAVIKNYQFVHQQNIDVAYRICREQGKSRGRLGTPQSPHVIAENMLPRDKQNRIFVEIWPTRMSPRPGWIFIDETC